MEPYTLIRSPKRKTMAICVKEDLTVVVRAPEHTPQEVIDQFVLENEDWIRRHVEMQRERRAQARTVTMEEEAQLRRQAKEVLVERIALFSAQMGLVPTGFRVTGARTRLGSCSGKNRLSFSFRLMAYPMSAIDLVVVHELAHIRYKHHGPSFYRLIEQYLPDYKTRLALLKDPRYRTL